MRVVAWISALNEISGDMYVWCRGTNFSHTSTNCQWLIRCYIQCMLFEKAGTPNIWQLCGYSFSVFIKYCGTQIICNRNLCLFIVYIVYYVCFLVYVTLTSHKADVCIYCISVVMCWALKRSHNSPLSYRTCSSNCLWNRLCVCNCKSSPHQEWVWWSDHVWMDWVPKRTTHQETWRYR